MVTADHAGVWDFSDPNQENEWLAKAWGSQMELRAIQKRNRDETIRARKAGEPKQRPSYGYMFIRLAPRRKSIMWRWIRSARRSSGRWRGGSWPMRRERSRSGPRRCG